jgi:predicted MFS family arabinose efflux permease
MSAEESPPRRDIVVLLAATLALASADTATVGATAVRLESALNIDNIGVGLLVTASTGFGAIATLGAGVLSDRTNRTRLLSWSILAWALALLVSGASSSYAMLLASRVVLGVASAFVGPLVASLIGDFFPTENRGRVYGLILSGELVGTGLGLFVSGEIAALLSWRFAFWWLTIPAVALTWGLRTRLPEPPRTGQSGSPQAAEPATGETAGDSVEREIEEQDVSAVRRLVLDVDPGPWSLWRATRYVLSVRTNLVLILASALGYFFFSALRTFAVVLLHDRFRLAQGSVSILLGLVGAGALVGVVSGGRLGDALLHRHYVVARPVLAGAAFTLAAVLFAGGLTTADIFVAAPFFVAAAACLGAANPPLDAARLDIMPPRLWGRAEAVRTLLRSLSEAVAPLLFGIVSVALGARSSTASTASDPASGLALAETFLVVLLPLLAAGILLSVLGKRTYPRDVATAIASVQAIRQRD